jgi:hypothetical protein
MLTVDHVNRRATGLGTGTITVADVENYVADRVRLGANGYLQLIDVRGVSVDIPPGESVFARVMAARRELKAPEIPRTAFVASAGSAGFGFVRQLATELGFANATVAVFANKREAEAWLVREPDG